MKNKWYVTLLAGVLALSFPSSVKGGGLMDFYYYELLKVSDAALFRQDGTINLEVRDALFAILDTPALDPLLRDPRHAWPNGSEWERDANFTTFTAHDFSRFVVPEPSNHSHSGAVIIQLFEPIPDKRGIQYGHLTDFTNQWWQLVFRTTDEGADVLTLYMMNPYRLSYFSGTRYDENHGRPDERYTDRTDGIGNVWRRIPVGENLNLSDEEYLLGLTNTTRSFEPNYSASIVRDNLIRDFNHVLAQFSMERFVVAPKNLPGQWQSSHTQTGTNAEGVFYHTGHFQPAHNTGNWYSGSEAPYQGLGASGRWGGHIQFNLMNGLDGRSVGPVNGGFFHSDIITVDHDLIWLPSTFEVRSMGMNKDTVYVQTFIETQTHGSQLVFDLDGDVPITQGGRTGLWRLNGFDRGFYPSAINSDNFWERYIAWERSTIVNGIGNANTVSASGNRYGLGVNQQAGVRPGIHLDLMALREVSDETP